MSNAMMSTDTSTVADTGVVAGGFAALAQGDLAGFGAMFADDATWDHRNQDRFAGVHRGREAILAYIGESAQLTAGTLRPVPTSVMADGRGRVCMLVDLTATRPDGRTLQDAQILVLTVGSGQVRGVDQYVGNPELVRAFWA